MCATDFRRSQRAQCRRALRRHPTGDFRDYGHAGQLGLEDSPDRYVAAIVEVFHGIRRVLRDDGTVWLNLGDSYASNTKGDTRSPEDLARNSTLGWASGPNTSANQCYRNQGPPRKLGHSLKSKDLVGIPWRVAFALQADGWYLRSDIIWSKPNPMPESVTDRPTKAHEYLFLLSKNARYYYDTEAIAEVSSMDSGFAKQRLAGQANWAKREGIDINGGNQGNNLLWADNGTRNKRSVWHVATQPYPEAHFATFPEALIEPCILAGSREGDTVFDPFTGSGTTGVVAIRHQRNFIGVELNPSYVQLARTRIGSVAPLLAEEVA